MALTNDDMARLSRLARLEVNPQTQQQTLDTLNCFFKLVEQMNAVDTDGVEPLAHPTDAMGTVAELRLRDDVVSEPATEQARTANQASAPAVERGLFLVPKVIE
jgi:aspartyl-tRNA(Asn)/glutamyl-tRNA(Gln) amidotransferase subunit C